MQEDVQRARVWQAGARLRPPNSVPSGRTSCRHNSRAALASAEGRRASDIQGNVLCGYGFRWPRYLTCNVRRRGRRPRGCSADCARAAQRRHVGGRPPPSATQHRDQPSGPAAARPPTRVLDAFPAEFRAGMAASRRPAGRHGAARRRSGEPGCVTARSRRSSWCRRAPSTDALQARQRTPVRAAVTSRRADRPTSATPRSRPPRRAARRASTSASRTASRSRRSRAAAGGRGQGVLTPPAAAGARSAGRVRARLSRRGRRGAGDATGRFVHNGTFMVWRKLEQDVALFRRWLRETAGGDTATRSWSRRRSWGAGPTARRWCCPIARGPPGGRQRNDFLYGADPHGLRCPVGAHVRRANPRDGARLRTDRTRRHRMIRRGMPYGALPDGGRRGRRRARPDLRVLQREHRAPVRARATHWLDDGDAFGLGGDRDFLLGPRGSRRAKMTVPGQSAVLSRRPGAVRAHARRRVPVRAGLRRARRAGRQCGDSGDEDASWCSWIRTGSTSGDRRSLCHRLPAGSGAAASSWLLFRRFPRLGQASVRRGADRPPRLRDNRRPHPRA